MNMSSSDPLYHCRDEKSLRGRLFDIFQVCTKHNMDLELVQVGYESTYIMASRDYKLFPDIAFEQVRASHADRICRDLLAAALDPLNHISALDAVCSQLMECYFAKRLCPEDLVEKSMEIIGRLPQYPLQMPQSMRLEIRNTGYLSSPEQGATWENLKSVEFFSSTTLKIIAAIASVALYKRKDTRFSVGKSSTLPDTLMELLDASSIHMDSARSEEELEAWSIVQAFLWTTWQRCTMVILWYNLGLQLEEGFYLSHREGYSLRQFKGGQKFQNIRETPAVPPYMCQWAFRLLSNDRSAVTSDFRRVFERFSDVFANREPRCVLGARTGPTQCDGYSVEHCQRFKGMKIIDQSAHSIFCGTPNDEPCRSLHWHENSYRAVDGARAVDVSQPVSDGLLRYCEASTRTLAISHVWSHGQGGRPELHETGLNSCLHRRYCRIVRDYGCDSYWLDTACIPQDHHLRRHAISQINDIFAQSRITLICDRDLMNINVDDSPLSIDVSEAIVSTILVCDWNVRAWTLLESLRGRNNIHILCQNDVVISARRIFEAIYAEGSIDIAILLLTSQHLVALESEATETARKVEPLDVPEATALVSQRHVSRPGDDIVIWSLMTFTEASFTAQTLWDRWRGMILRTGYLMSDLPRLKDVHGHTWAPSQPLLVTSVYTHDPVTSQMKQNPGRVFDGVGSGWGIVTDRGFQATWNVSELTWRSQAGSRDVGVKSLDATRILHDIGRKYEVKQDVICFAYPGPHGPMANEDNRAIYIGHAGGYLYALLSPTEQDTYEWLGLYEWPGSVVAPVFTSKILMIA